MKKYSKPVLKKKALIPAGYPVICGRINMCGTLVRRN